MQQQKRISQGRFSKIAQCLSSFTPSQILSEEVKQKKRTKTVCTIGPKSQTVQNAGKLMGEGMNVARLNFSHGTHQQHHNKMLNILQAAKNAGNLNIGIMLDTKGPEIRTGINATEQIIKLKTGQTLQITTDYTFKGTSSRIACSYPDLPKFTAVGKKILIADGGISTRVTKIEDNIVTVEVLNDGSIGSKKNMCLPGTVITLPTIGSNDQIDIVNFGLKHKVNFIAVSFARERKELQNLRKLLIQKDPQHGPYIQIISKIQNDLAFHNLDEVIEASDGIMVARGDLGMEVPIQKVVILQKYMTDRAINAGKIVVTATQMIESMQTKPRPTRAQVADITNAVLDLTDANMTSGETANGQYPVQCVKFLRLIAQETQHVCNYKQIFLKRMQNIKQKDCVAAIFQSFAQNCHFIFIQTQNIKLIHRLSTLRPWAYIIVLCNNQKVKKAVALDFGVEVFPIQAGLDFSDFLRKNGSSFCVKANQSIKMLKLYANGNKIQGSKIFQGKIQQ